ncbi:hypothetical protein IH979_01490 [Patescibacteria group bacterium]|nr:hypothetical protein [Patescibacteria group bacterium]
MNLRQYIFTFGFGTAIAWMAWFIVLMNIDPATVGIAGFIVFYVTLFVGLAGLFTTIATVIRVWRYRRGDFEDAVKRSLRQGVTLAGLVEGALLLASRSLLTWWTLILLVAFVALIEFFFLTSQKESET